MRYTNSQSERGISVQQLSRSNLTLNFWGMVLGGPSPSLQFSEKQFSEKWSRKMVPKNGLLKMVSYKWSL